ncbi:type II toxin-antitoxin system VapC family toxin [Desulfotomaculum copahuensis]|uniref:type II toxin-antitoxin system VapC family toxin n=1 Tax=Desulfotomaculum copahuensis TaxID=1838280 RepID=UPI00098FA59C|nr:type II toxin-antitoxin system VapC family toxin [Desulfotomaculum copahuensis]
MAEQVLIDSTVIISHLRTRSKSETLFERTLKKIEKCYISAITAWEIEYGAVRAKRTTDLDNILPLVEVIPFGLAEAQMAAIIYADLKSRNQTIDIKDVYIAGTCLVHRLPLVTENREHFRRVDGLALAGL